VIITSNVLFLSLAAAPPLSKPPGANAKPADDGSKKADGKKASLEKPEKSGLFGRLLGTIGIKVSNQAHLPDDKDQAIVWDEKTKVRTRKQVMAVAEEPGSNP
jgi:hypothetical protein